MFQPPLFGQSLIRLRPVHVRSESYVLGNGAAPASGSLSLSRGLTHTQVHTHVHVNSESRPLRIQACF